MAKGEVGEASAAIRRITEEVSAPGPRARVLDACVEIMLAANDLPAARRASQELAEISARQDIPFLCALSSRAVGTVLLAEGHAEEALVELKRSWSLWCELQAPYEAARVRILIALALRTLGDEESALHELTAARETFARLGAAIDLARINALLPKESCKSAGPLTERELQVLKLVASGITNRGIAEKLHISEKTVARHMSNIFMKLDLSSRTAAAAYAYDHNLV